MICLDYLIELLVLGIRLTFRFLIHISFFLQVAMATLSVIICYADR